MNPDDFSRFLQRELGLDYAPRDLFTPFDELHGWDSVHLLRLMTALPHLDAARVLAASSLDEVRLLEAA